MSGQGSQTQQQTQQQQDVLKEIAEEEARGAEINAILNKVQWLQEQQQQQQGVALGAGPMAVPVTSPSPPVVSSSSSAPRFYGAVPNPAPAVQANAPQVDEFRVPQQFPSGASAPRKRSMGGVPDPQGDPTRAKRTHMDTPSSPLVRRDSSSGALGLGIGGGAGAGAGVGATSAPASNSAHGGHMAEGIYHATAEISAVAGVPQGYRFAKTSSPSIVSADQTYRGPPPTSITPPSSQTQSQSFSLDSDGAVEQSSAAAAVTVPAPVSMTMRRPTQQFQQNADVLQQQQQTPPQMGAQVSQRPLQCPELVVDTLVAHRDTPFRLRLTVSGAWRRRYGLEVEDILRICLTRVKVCREGTAEELPPCTVCACVPLVTVTCSNKEIFGPVAYGDAECFTCDLCVSHCSNSAEHIGGKVTLVLDTLPELGALSTAPIALLDRFPSTQQVSIQPASATATPRKSVPLPPTFAASAPQPQQQQFVPQQSGIVAAAPGATTTATALSVSPVPIGTDVQSQQQMTPSTAAAAAMAMASGFSRLPDAKVVVRVWSTKLERHTLEMLLEDYKASHLHKLGGVIDFSYKIAQGLAITFTSYTSTDMAKEGLTLEQRYMQNDGMRNVLNSDLECNGLVGCICACACW